MLLEKTGTLKHCNIVTPCDTEKQSKNNLPLNEINQFTVKCDRYSKNGTK